MRPVPRNGAGRTIHSAHPANTWSQESLFNRLSRYSMFRPIGPIKTVQALKDAWAVRNPLLAYGLPGKDRPLEAMKRFMTTLECDAHGALATLTGSDLLSLQDRESRANSHSYRVLATSLRYCKFCMEQGFHSMLFQHRAVSHCPLHSIALLDKCVDCGAPILPTIAGTVAKPYCCPSCDCLLLKTVVPPEACDSIKLANVLIENWRRDLAVPTAMPDMQVPATAIESFADVHPTHRAQHTRLIQRATAWPEIPTARWPRFREVQMRVDEAYLPTSWPPQTQLDNRFYKPTEILRWLVQVCAVPRGERMWMLAMSWMRIQYLTSVYQGVHLSAVGAALHVILTRYADLRTAAHVFQCDLLQADPYADVVWNGMHAPSISRRYGDVDGELVAMEITGYFAITLLYCAGLNSLGAVEHETQQPKLEEADYCPSWRLSSEGVCRWQMRMRPRATEDLVLRLIRRFEGRGLQRMVTCSAPTGLAREKRVDVGTDTIPRELLHFPAGTRRTP